MLKLEDIRKSKNIISLLDKDDSEDRKQLNLIANSVVNGYRVDEASRADWKKTVDKAMDMATQTKSAKSFPWPKSSNVQYPLIYDATTAFAARVIPEIITPDKIVKLRIVGKDKDEQKYLRACRVENFMTYQLANDPDWYAGVDSLLHILPVVGTAFKKTYYSETEKRNISEVCSPDKICVNYGVTSLESARRITHIITLSINDIIQRQRMGLFDKNINVDMLKPDGADANDNDYEVELLEQHCWYDLDDDGYKEPYVVTIHEKTKQILRIVSCIKSIERKDGEIVRIIPWQYFTDFHFIKSPDGGFYSMGFGQLLLPINSAINSLMNQLIDAGTLSVTQGGFLGKGLRIKSADFQFKPFEWKMVDAAAGTDLAKSVYQFPVREPSNVLFSLLNTLLQTGKELSASNDAMQGRNNGTNVSENVQNSMVEQGSQVFAAINKRFYNSQTKEYKKLYELNYYNLDDKTYRNVLDDQAANVKADFDLESNDIVPVADPNLSSQKQRLQRGQALYNLRTADPRAVDVYILRTLQFDEDQINQICPQPDPNAPPSPEVQKLMAETTLANAQAQMLATEQQTTLVKIQMEAQAAQTASREAESRVQESMARVWKMQKDAAHGDQKVLIAGGKMQYQESLKQAQAESKAQIDQANVMLAAKDRQLKETEITAKTLLEDKKLNIMARKEGVAAKPPKPEKPKFNMEDVRYTARLKGMSVPQVLAQLGEV